MSGFASGDALTSIVLSELFSRVLFDIARNGVGPREVFDMAGRTAKFTLLKAPILSFSVAQRGFFSEAYGEGVGSAHAATRVSVSGPVSA